MRLDDFEKVLNPKLAKVYFTEARWALLNAGVSNIDACVFDLDRLSDGKAVVLAFGKDGDGADFVWTKRVMAGALRD